ncbi:uncharacterized protein NEMAJ01_2193 [Nematocida major]|uniref:uncharacterized protein n=1 Tax=Nematocida major TaxID=1912982 RepID=UPI00200865E5|nr:uncharacterized protein NEMAJ01_2193 [Nematocida major]KAH9387297.1 hypothetical protein NEMAJ01_2193 [Nematocida major]
MYFSNRSYMDKVGLSLTYFLIGYIGVASGPLLLWEDLKEWEVTRGILALLNAFVVLDLLLLVCVSRTRGYVREEEYVPGGRFCYECRMAKPERAHHCTRCKKCITKMDHHCPWVGSCINASNLGNFIKLISSLFISAVLSLCLHSYVFRLRIREVYDSVVISPSICLICVNILVMLLAGVGVLFIMIRQIRLMLLNETYLEHLQVRRLEELGLERAKNPYRKSLRQNMGSVFGGPLHFLLCRAPAGAASFGYRNYWPPLRTAKSISSSHVELNALVGGQTE